MELLKIDGRVSKREKGLELRAEIFCVTTTQLSVSDLKLDDCEEEDKSGDDQ